MIIQAKAKARFVRVGPRKLRLIVNLVKGMNAEKALAQLKFMPKSTARPVFKLLESAIANAVNNFQAKKETLVVAQAFVDNGPMIKRMMPRAMGRGTPIRHHTAHITMILEGEGNKTVKEAKTEEKTEVVVEANEEEKKKIVKKEVKKLAAKRTAKTKK